MTKVELLTIAAALLCRKESVQSLDEAVNDAFYLHQQIEKAIDEAEAQEPTQ